MREVNAKLLHILKERKAGEHIIQDITIELLDPSKKQINVAVFTKGAEFSFQEGDELLIPLSTNQWTPKGSNKVLTSYSCSLSKITPLKQVDEIFDEDEEEQKEEPKAEPKTEQEEKNKYWSNKDRLIVRQNSNAHGVEIVKLWFQYCWDEKKDGKMSCELLTNMALLSADLFDSRVYKKDGEI